MFPDSTVTATLEARNRLPCWVGMKLKPYLKKKLSWQECVCDIRLVTQRELRMDPGAYTHSCFGHWLISVWGFAALLSKTTNRCRVIVHKSKKSKKKSLAIWKCLFSQICTESLCLKMLGADFWK
uniref:Uncharacterized protein n=1 Tax=Micrurus corallinus TaxID=54390 RepID=A0A2D4FR08_MICCO